MRYGVPRVPTWNVARVTLLDRLDPAAPLLLVHGPAGSGTTTLVADWALTRHPEDRPLVWVDLTGLSDPAAVWSAVIDAVVDAGLAARPPAGSGSAVTSQADRHSLLRGTGPVTIVLDGLRRPGEAFLARDVVDLVRTCPWLHLAITTHGDPRALRRAASLSVDLVELGPDDLALTTDEVAQVLGDSGSDPAAAPAVREATGGLPIAVRALVVAAAHSRLDLRTASPETLSTVAAAEVVRALRAQEVELDDRVVAIARRLSVATRATPQLARLLAGEQVDDVLDDLVAMGLGTWSADPRPAFVLIPVVRNALRADLARHEPALVDPLLRTVVEQGLVERDPTTALTAATELGDTTLVGTVLLTSLATGATGDSRQTLRLLRRLPTASLSHDPVLAFVIALSYGTDARQRPRALEWLALASAAIAHRAPQADRHERTMLGVAEAVVLRLRGQAEQAAATARLALDQLDTTPRGANQRIDLLQPVAHRQLGLTLAVAGHLGEGIAAINRALAYEQPCSAGEFTVHALLAGLTATQHDLRVAAEHLAAVDRMPQPPRTAAPYQHALADLARILLWLEAGDIERAELLLDELGPELTTHELWAPFAQAWASIDLLRARPAVGEERLVQAMRAGRRAPLPTHWSSALVATRALLALADGQGERGLAMLAPLPSSHQAVRVVRARLLVSTGRLEQASSLLASADLPDEGPWLRSARRFLLAATADALGRPRVARTSARQGVAISRAASTASGWLVLSADERAVLRRLLAGTGEEETEAFLRTVERAPCVLPGRVGAADLTRREQVVLTHLAEDVELAGVAARLHVSPNTVKSQVRGVYRKLGVASRAEAVARAKELGLL